MKYGKWIYKTVFLNRHLLGDVYIVYPGGFVKLKYPNKMCKLSRSIYVYKANIS